MANIAAATQLESGMTPEQSSSETEESAPFPDRGYWSLLKQTFFSAYLSNQILINLGDGIFGLLVTFSALSLNASAAELGLIVSCIALPRGLLGLYGGVIADQYRRRVIMQLCDLARTVGIALVGILVWTGNLSLFNLTLLASLVTLTSAFSKPAGKAILPEVVDASDLYLANGMTQSVLWPSFFLGAFLAGSMDTSGLFSAYSYLMCAGVFAIAGMVLGLVQPGRLKKTTENCQNSILTDIIDGISELARHRALLIRVVGYLFFSLIWRGMTQVGLPLYTVEALNLPASFYSTLIIAAGLGEFVSSLIIAKLAITRSLKFSFIGEALLGIALLTLSLNLSSSGLSTAIALFSVMLVGVSASLVHVPLTTAIQTDISSSNSGKVFSIWNTLGTLGGSLGALVISGMISISGTTMTLITLMLFSLLILLLSYCLAYPRDTRSKDLPADLMGTVSTA
ncbi:MFS transporter [Hahella ganghwensis]|uniref:MFS transporter n=1 Tax=Hahella ganghwensis TaxID=286420 RepID=UPI0003604DEC|nr:MFS transporter [Hahella ganghwensis]